MHYSVYAVLSIVNCCFTIVAFPNCVLVCKMQLHFSLIIIAIGFFLNQLVIIFVLSDAAVLPYPVFNACIS